MAGGRPRNDFSVLLEVLMATYEVDSGMVVNGDPESNRAALQAAVDLANARGGGCVRFRAAVGSSSTVYPLGRAGANSWCLDLKSNVYLVGDAGVWLKLPAGQAAQAIAMVRFNNVSNCGVHRLAFDGNWGNAVGYIDDDVGINHDSMEGNPIHFALHIRGSTNVTITDVNIKQMYGDGIELISSTTGAVCDNVNIQRVTVDMCARHALTFSNGAINASCRDFKFTNIFAGCVDVEPVGTFKTTRNIVLENGYIGRWWSNTNIANRIIFAVVGSDSGGGQTSCVRNFHVRNVTIDGPTLIGNVLDCTFDQCRFINDFPETTAPPLAVDHTAEGLTISNSFVYDRAGSTGVAHQGAVQLRHYGTIMRPSRVVLKNLRVQAKNGRHGIAVDGIGGVRSHTGTADSITATTLVQTGAGWTVNQFAGGTVRVGTTHAAIASNTSDTLTVYAWYTAPFGSSDVAATTPSPGAFTILGKRAEVIIDDCSVDCTDDGYGAGGVGLYLDAGDITAIPGNFECKVSNLKVKNATADAVKVQSRNAANPFRLLVLDGVDAVDDQPTPTCATAVRFVTSPAVNITKIVMRGIGVDGVAAYFAGVGTASPNLTRWLREDGEVQVWEGYNSPNGVFSAPKGSTFHRRDGGASTTLYLNETGTTTWRAV